MNLKIKDQIWIGSSYRQDFGPSIFVGIDFGKLFSVYSYDLSTNEVYSYSGGSHEISMALKLYCAPKKKKFRTMSCPAF